MNTTLLNNTRTDHRVPSWFEGTRYNQDIVGAEEIFEDRELWRRYYKERLKTVSYAVVMCLNLGVEPPDMMRRQLPCGKMECWVDPQGMSPKKAVQQIVKNIQATYERWQPRARFKIATDPTVEEVRRLCQGMRRNAKDERVLFHYNGHGVPKPTENGELWVFNKSFTQYIPLSIYDLQTWICNPSVYVWDCNSAGLIVKSFSRFAGDQEKEWVKQLDEHMETKAPPLPMIQAAMSIDQRATAFGFPKKPNFRDCIHLAACGDDEYLPIDPDLPADLFTSCLTTPIKTSILWHILKNGLKDSFPLSNLDKFIPGEISDRRSVLGELNWIFTAITDTIAWDALSKELFQKIFRLDLVLASLCRSFLLAERVMLAYNRHVVSEPKLPSLHDHPLWDAWDFTLDHCLDRIRGVTLQNSNTIWNLGKELHFVRTSLRYNVLIELNSDWYKSEKENGMPLNWFFKDQLKAFDLWLRYGADKRTPPQQLPVVLQVLLSQQYRVEALKLLARFLDLGAWAVGHALTVGIFPYMLKLLQSGLKDLRQWLAFIWAKILAVEPNCQSDLVKDKEQGYLYFITILNDISVSPWHKIASAFVTAAIIHNDYRPAQDVLSSNGYISICVELLSGSSIEKCHLLKLWLLIGLGRLWSGHNKARWQAIRLVAHDRVMDCLNNPVPEIRAAAMYALGCLVRNRSESNEHASSVDHEICERIATKCMYEGSVLVRAELVVALQWFVIDFEQHFANLYLELSKKLENKILLDPDYRKCRKWSYDRAKNSLQEDEFYEFKKGPFPNERILLSRGHVTDLHRIRVQGVPQRSNSMVLGPLYEHNDSSFTAGNYRKDKTGNDAESLFKRKVRDQMQLLEKQSFMTQVERVWFGVLWLSLDPVKKIAEMSRVLIKYVEKVAEAKKERFSNIYRQSTVPITTSIEKVNEKVRSPERPTFTIGSPTSSTFEKPSNISGDSHMKGTVAVSGLSPSSNVRIIQPSSSNVANVEDQDRSTNILNNSISTMPKLVKEQQKEETAVSTSAPVDRPPASNMQMKDQIDINEGKCIERREKNSDPGAEMLEQRRLPCGSTGDDREAFVHAEIAFVNDSEREAYAKILKDGVAKDLVRLEQAAADLQVPQLHPNITPSGECSTSSSQFENSREKDLVSGNKEVAAVIVGKESVEKSVDNVKAEHVLHDVSRLQNISRLDKSGDAPAAMGNLDSISVSTPRKAVIAAKRAKQKKDVLMTSDMASKGTGTSYTRPVSVGANSIPKEGRRNNSKVAKSVPDVALEAPIVLIESPDVASEASTIPVAIDAVEELAEDESGIAPSYDRLDALGKSVQMSRNSALQSSSAGVSSVRQRSRTQNFDTSAGLLFDSPTIFTPTRKVHAPSMNSMVRLDEFGLKSKEPLAPLVTTEFIPWCSKRITEPLLDVIERRVDDGYDEESLSYKWPSDWAHYKHDELFGYCDKQLFFFKPEKPVACLAWSYLRPHIYTCDGKKFDIWKYEMQKMPEIKRRIDCADNNPYCSDKVCQLEVLNVMTHELILMGSTDGLIRIWDPGYSIHSSEFEKDQRMLTAAYLLKDELRFNDRLKTVYGWHQQKGCVIASGNVSVCRFWDAVTERKLHDLKIIPKVKLRKASVTKICSDAHNPELLCLGMSDGMIYSYDLRLPFGEKQRVMSLMGLRDPIVGLSTFSQLDGNEIFLVAGTDRGQVNIWDPRMFEEPYESFNVCSNSRKKDTKVLSFDIHSYGKLLSCALSSSEVRVYDVHGGIHGVIRPDDALIGGCLGATSAIRFHPLRAMLAVSTEKHMVSAYGLPHAVL